MKISLKIINYLMRIYAALMALFILLAIFANYVWNQGLFYKNFAGRMIFDKKSFVHVDGEIINSISIIVCIIVFISAIKPIWIGQIFNVKHSKKIILGLIPVYVFVFKLFIYYEFGDYLVYKFKSITIDKMELKIDYTAIRFSYVNNHIMSDYGIHGGIQFDKVYWQNQAWMDGRKYEKLVGMHPPNKGIAYADFSIPDSYSYFISRFGMARDDAHPSLYGDAIGRVYFDGQKVWEDRVAGGIFVHDIEIAIPKNAKVMRLEVDSNGPNLSDQTIWANARFSTTKDRRYKHEN